MSPRIDQKLPRILAMTICLGSSGVLTSESQQSRSFSEVMEPAARVASSNRPQQHRKVDMPVAYSQNDLSA